VEESTEFGFGHTGGNLAHDGTKSVNGSVKRWGFP
jgi:hypothetical protein